MSDWLTLQQRLGLTLRPIGAWPGRMTRDRERGPFSAPLKDTLTTLERELRHLSARSIVLQIALREDGFRLDGLPRAGAKAEHPGVILAFESKHGSLRLHMDRFRTWEHNLRAVGMHLEHLRRAGLYGVGADGQQYRGWKALPDGETQAGEFTGTVEEAARLLMLAAQRGFVQVSCMAIESNPEAFTMARRAAVQATHPDRGGSQDEWCRLQQAVALMEKHHATR